MTSYTLRSFPPDILVFSLLKKQLENASFLILSGHEDLSLKESIELVYS